MPKPSQPPLLPSHPCLNMSPSLYILFPALKFYTGQYYSLAGRKLYQKNGKEVPKTCWVPGEKNQESHHLRGTSLEDQQPSRCLRHPLSTRTSCSGSWGMADPGPDPPPRYHTPSSEGPLRPRIPSHRIPCIPTKSLPWCRARRAAGPNS